MHRADAGYTVLEALVAFAILSAILVSLYGAAGTSLRAVDKGTRLETVAMLAQSKLDEIAAVRGPLPTTSSGTFTNSDVSWRIETDHVSGQNETSPLLLQDVHLTLIWSAGTSNGSFELRTRHLGTVRR
jgi:type II secretory pathway pseudopilin PulG